MTIARRTALGVAASAIVAPALLGAAPAFGQAAPPAAGPPFHRFRVGALTVTVVTDGTVSRDISQGAVVNATNEQAIAAARAAGIEGNIILNPYNITFIETARGLIAFDIGTGGVPNTATGTLHANMRAAGLDPARVALIVHTHFHGDHINGLTRGDGTAIFPQVQQIFVPEREWTYWTDAGEESRATEMRRPGFANTRRRFAPYEGKVARFAPGAEVLPSIRAVATNGHSPGHTSFIIHDGNAQALIIGDAITTPAFFMANPEWYPGFDQDPAMAVDTRKRLLDRAAAERMPVVGYHFPMPATGIVERAGTGFRMVPAA